MNICIIASSYPNKRFTTFPFVKQLVDGFARLGHDCTVIAPYSVNSYKSFYKYKDVETIEGGGTITILRPNIITTSKLKFGGKDFTTHVYDYIVNRELKKLKVKPDVIYGHFWVRAMHAYKYAKKHNIPLFVATGESTIAVSADKEFAEYVHGVICVSTKNLNESVSKGLTDGKNCKVFPNAIDPTIFNRRDYIQCRKSLGINLDDFVIAFVGSFIERKGVLRVAEAINRLNDPSIKVVFIGSGEQDPECPGILFKGKLLHEEIPSYLSASDVFVLPTLKEGCCNAIVEAMACGLPIISSNLEFNQDILDSSNSIMLNPMNVSDITAAILKLKNNRELRKKIAEGSLERVKELDIDNRAYRIMEFIKSRTKQYE